MKQDKPFFPSEPSNSYGFHSSGVTVREIAKIVFGAALLARGFTSEEAKVITNNLVRKLFEEE